MKLVFTRSAFRQLKKLDKKTQKRIDEKLIFYLSQENPLSFAEPMRDFRFGSFRFRIGDYRVLFDVKDDTIIVLKIGPRRNIYQ